MTEVSTKPRLVTVIRSIFTWYYYVIPRYQEKVYTVGVANKDTLDDFRNMMIDIYAIKEKDVIVVIKEAYLDVNITEVEQLRHRGTYTIKFLDRETEKEITS
jgi:hypothetical protein